MDFYRSDVDDADLDKGGGGYTKLQEYKDGYDPTDPTSHPADIPVHIFPLPLSD